MLKALLQLIKSGDPRTPQELAEALGTSVPLIEQMIAQLTEAGYLSVAELCGDGCDHCALASACRARPGTVHFWTLTPKGVNACS
ncbi:MAG TPA: winged helix-turn-helix transcriptional regulator [Anaerolineae bacterium]|nr:winged helix-turn-helix transcriptional regulator [Anaerolineae bacterium]HQK15097.1 winged helix-turn-helix transcriptional regulator [Anaerolineae bacterium]